jgi:hypothetical protein
MATISHSTNVLSDYGHVAYGEKLIFAIYTNLHK